MTLFKRDNAPEAPAAEESAYDRHRRNAAANQAEKSRKGREIGEIPAPADKARREACRHDLKLFCETYLRYLFRLAWSRDHLKAVRKTQNAILEGGLFALAMPRGSGKSTLFIAAIVWAIIYGHHKFGLLVGANQKASLALIKNIKKICRESHYADLHADFPDVFVPLQKLEGIANRAQGQTHNGEATEVVWGKETIVFAKIAGCEASGGIIQTGAIKSAVRGANVGGLRPTLCLLDDPQTKTSAKSDTQTDEREEIVSADVLGLPGPDDTITALMACTVIEPGDPGDLAARFLDRKRHPNWQGERFQLVDAFPTNMELWQEYRELGVDAQNRDCSPAEVRKILDAFYTANRAKMDAGADIPWPERHPDCLSGLQYAMNLFFRDEPAFWSEYQNQPLERTAAADEATLTADQIARRINRVGRGVVPLQAQHLVAFTDVHKKLLYWMICWFADDFTGGVLDYGAFPDQQKLNFKMRDASPTLQSSTKDRGTGKLAMLAAVRAGLDAVADQLLARRFRRDGDGLDMQIERYGVDANWGEGRDAVYDHAREHAQKSIIRSCHGRGLKASDKPMSEWKVPANEKIGFHWVRKTVSSVRYMLIDTNYWKSFAHNGLSLPFEERHSLSLYQAKPHEHRLLAEHFSSETRSMSVHKGRSVEVWDPPKSGIDNHWWDCFVGCCVMASELGITLRTTPKPASSPGKKREPKFSQI